MFAVSSRDYTRTLLAGIGLPDLDGAARTTLVREQRLSPIVNDVAAFDATVLALEKAPPPTPNDPERVTPFICVPWTTLKTQYPLAEFVMGALDDPFAVSRRACTYLILRDGNGTVQLVGVNDETVLELLAVQAPLEEVLMACRNARDCLALLWELTEARALIWLRPDRSRQADD